MFFQVSGVFSGIRRKFVGLRSGTFFRPKEDPGICTRAIVLCTVYIYVYIVEFLIVKNSLCSIVMSINMHLTWIYVEIVSLFRLINSFFA